MEDKSFELPEEITSEQAEKVKDALTEAFPNLVITQDVSTEGKKVLVVDDQRNSSIADHFTGMYGKSAEVIAKMAAAFGTSAISPRMAQYFDRLPPGENDLGSSAVKYIPSHEVKNMVKDLGRNEPCMCGSGKKYKKCCGKI